MAPSAAAIASLAQGLARATRPLSAPPIVSGASIRLATASRAASTVSNITQSGLTRAARPYPFTNVSRTVGLERAGMVRARNAGQSVLTNIARKEQAAFARQTAVAAARSRVATALRPSAGATAAVRGVLSKVPMVGKVAQKLFPIVRSSGPFLALTALTVIPSIFEYLAPGVHDWLLGGWRGPGYGKVNPNAGQLQFDGNPNSFYNIEMWGNNGLGVIKTYDVFNQPGLTSAYLTTAGGNWIINWTKTETGSTIQSINTFRYTSVWTGVYLVVYKNGTLLTKEPAIVRPDIVTQNPKRVAPTVTPAATPQTGLSPAEIARLAALAAVAATIAAGKYRTQPPPSRDALKTPQKRYGTQLAPSPTQTGPASQPCKGNACGQAGLDATKENGEDLKKILDLLSLLGIEDLKKTVKRIDEKAGDQIVDGRGNKIGIGGAVLETIGRVNKVGDYLRFDRITNVLTLAATVHNAAMLSRNLGETLASALSSALAAIGIKDADGDQLDINKIVGKSVESAITSAIGAENYTELTTNWKKASRIYQASANLLNNVQSLRYSITGALETIAGMNGKVANALKKYGVLGDNAYPWMNPTPNFDNKFMRGLETVENAVSSVDSIASEVLSAQETVTEIGKQKTELATAIKDGTEKPSVDNTQQKAKATAAKTVSKSPDIVSDNFIKPEG